MRLGHGRCSADDGVVCVQLHRNDEYRVSSALLGIHTAVGFEGVVLAAAEFDRCVGLAAPDGDLVAADVRESPGAA